MELKDLSYAELQELIDLKKQGEVDAVTSKLKAAREIVSTLEAELENLTGKQTAKASRTPKGQSKELVLSFLKNNPGSKPREVIAMTGLTSSNLNALLGKLKKSGEVVVEKSSYRLK